MEDLADFFLMAGVEFGVNYMVGFFLVQGGANPFCQVFLPKLWINWESTGHQLKNDHSKAVDVTLFVHPKSITIFCFLYENMTLN